MTERRGKQSVKPLRDLLESLDEDLMRQVFTHTSWVENRADSYERLAYIGDSVLSLAVSTELYPRFSAGTAGKLTKIRAQAVSGRACKRVAIELDVPKRLTSYAPPGPRRTVGELVAAERAMAEICEAVIGACYLTFGFDKTAPAVVAAFEQEIRDAVESPYDFKSTLQERLARKGLQPCYKTISEDGPAHARQFVCIAEVRGDEYGRGTGKSKKDAEQAAAKAALDAIKERRGSRASSDKQ